MPAKKKTSAKNMAVAKKKPVAVKKSNKTTNKAAPRKRTTNKQKKVTSAMKPEYTGFPIVGIGASAGGLEAISELHRHCNPLGA